MLGPTVNGVTTFNQPLLLRAGVARDEVTGGAPVTRWGDYSSTVVDPTDPFTFWTFQEWVSAENIWSTQITQLKADLKEPLRITNMAEAYDTFTRAGETGARGVANDGAGSSRPHSGPDPSFGDASPS